MFECVVSVFIRKEEEEARAKSVRERLGMSEAVEKVAPTADVDEVVKTICKRLNEPKVPYETLRS